MRKIRIGDRWRGSRGDKEKRRGDSTDLAARVEKNLMDISSLKFLQLTSQRAEEAAEIASEIAVRGVDALVVEVARGFDTPPVTLDTEIISRAKTLVRIQAADALVR